MPRVEVGVKGEPPLCRSLKGSGITGRVEAVPESIQGSRASRECAVREQKQMLNWVCVSHAKAKPHRLTVHTPSPSPTWREAAVQNV